MQPVNHVHLVATAWAADPAHGIRVDQQRIGDRFLELLAERRRPVLVTRPRISRGPLYQIVVDETHAEFFRRWEAVLDSFRHGGRQGGKTEAMTRFLDEAERLTGVRPTHIRANLRGDVSIAADGADVDDPAAWTKVGNPLDLVPAEPLAEKMPDPWREVGYTDGGGTVWVAPAGTPWPRQRAQGWSKEPLGDEKMEAIRAACQEAVLRLADELGLPRRFFED